MILLSQLAVTMATGCAAVNPIAGLEAQIRALDEQQRRMVAEADIIGLQALAHPNLAINAPGNRVLSKDQFLSNMRSGEIRSERFTRAIEDIRATGNVAVVMGRETFTPATDSELGRAYGAVPLNRRYTNIYLREGKCWRWLARHANIIPSPVMTIRPR